MATELPNYSHCASKALAFITERLTESGSLGTDLKDVCCYYKAPMMFISAGRLDTANQILSHIKTHYMQPSGDFMTDTDTKSAKGEYAEFWGYVNGWIVRASQICGRDDITVPALAYLMKYCHSNNGGCLTHRVDEKNDLTTDLLMTAHLGLIHLEGGRIERAVAAGDYLCAALAAQPCLKKALYLRLDSDSNVVTEFDTAMAPFMVVERAKPHQLYFMLGYPIAYLTLLFEKTGEAKYLESSKEYARFALCCNASVFNSNFSHKLAWGLSLLQKYESGEWYINAIRRIGDQFEKLQGKEGIWYYPSDLNTAFDQSAEITLWMMEITKNLAPKGPPLPCIQ